MQGGFGEQEAEAFGWVVEHQLSSHPGPDTFFDVIGDPVQVDQPSEDVPRVLGGLQQSGNHVRNEHPHQGRVGLQWEVSPLPPGGA